jgi:hypothetical protein
MIFMFHDDVGEEVRSATMDVQRVYAKMGPEMLRTIVTGIQQSSLWKRHESSFDEADAKP